MNKTRLIALSGVLSALMFIVMFLETYVFTNFRSASRAISLWDPERRNSPMPHAVLLQRAGTQAAKPNHITAPKASGLKWPQSCSLTFHQL